MWFTSIAIFTVITSTFLPSIGIVGFQPCIVSSQNRNHCCQIFLSSNAEQQTKNSETKEIGKDNIPAHNKDYLTLVAENKKRAAERRLANSKKFWRKKVIFDHMRDKARAQKKAENQATRWERNVTHPIETLERGQWLTGRVRNLESFGAWVDVGAERDGLIHVSDMSEGFTPRVQDAISTGDIVNVTVKRVDASANQLSLSLLPLPVVDVFFSDRNKVPLSEVEEGDEMWGEVTKVTNFGVFVHLGVEVLGFLHITEWPSAGGRRPSEIFSRNQRIRTYAKEVDIAAKRLKLTAIRPSYLPRVGSSSGVKYNQNINIEKTDRT